MLIVGIMGMRRSDAELWNDSNLKVDEKYLYFENYIFIFYYCNKKIKLISFKL